MKSRFLLMIVLAALGLGLSAQPLHWRESSPSTFIPVTIAPDFDNFTEGSKSVKITFTETGTPYYISDTFNVTTGAAYNFSIDVLDNDAGGEVNTRLVFIKSNNTTTNVTSPTYSSNDPTWQTLSMTGTVPAEMVKAYLVVRIYDVSANWTGSATFNLDNAKYSEDSGTTNLILNPGFEAWTPPVIAPGAQPLDWIESSPSTFAPLTVAPEFTNVSYGFVSLKITFTETGTPYFVCDTFDVVAGAPYNLSIDVLDNDAGAEVNTRLVFINANGTTSNVTSPTYSSNDPAWQTLSMTGTVPADMVKAYLVVRIYDVAANWTGSATFLLDNAKYIESAGTDNLIRNPSFENWTAPSATPEFLTYKFAGLTPNVNGIINKPDHTIALTVPFVTDVTTLVSTYTLSDGAMAKVGATDQVSGTTPNDFTNPVTYNLSKDTTSQDWVVTVTKVAPTTGKDIITFKFESLTPVVTGVVDPANKTVSLEVPNATNVAALIPTITLSPNATVSPLSGVATDFTSPVTFTVTAQDGSTQAWVVTVTKAVAGQTTLFFEDFEKSSLLTPGITLINNDNFPMAVGEERWADSCWVVSTTLRPELAGTHVAMASSFVTMGLSDRVDRWMILPSIALGSNSTLSWQAMSTTTSGNYPDDYTVYIAPVTPGIDPTVAYFEENGNILMNVAPENWSAAVGRPGAGLANRSLNLKNKITPDAPAGWHDRSVYIAFVLNTDLYTNPTTGIPNSTSGGSALAIDNIKVVDIINTGLADNKLNTLGASLYPNPARNEVNVAFQLQSGGTAQISVRDLTGREVLNFSKRAASGVNELKMDISDLKKGAYMVRTFVDNKATVTKLIIH